MTEAGTFSASPLWSVSYPMVIFSQEGTISEEEGMRFATNPEALRMNLQGIFLDEGKRILNV